jgi:hypothetical protein
MQPGHFSHMRLTGDGEQAQRDLLTNPVSALSIICGHDGFPGLQSPGRAIVDYDWEVTASFDQPPSQPKTNRQKGHHKRLKRRRNRVGLPPAEPIPVLPSFKEQEVATAIEETLRLAACRLPESQIIEKSGYARTAVRKQLARLVKLGTIIHHGKRGGYSPSNSEHKP